VTADFIVIKKLVTMTDHQQQENLSAEGKVPLRQSIAYKLLASILFVSTIITGISVAGLLKYNLDHDLEKIEVGLENIHATIVPSLARAIWEYNKTQLATQLKGLMTVSGVKQVRLVIGDKNQPDEVITIPLSVVSESGQMISRDYDIYYEDENIPSQVVGTLSITATTKGAYESLWSSAGYIILSQFVKTLFVSFFIVWLVNVILTRHIQSVTHFTRMLSVDSLREKLSLERVGKNQKTDELDLLVDAINRMRTQLLSGIEARINSEQALAEEAQEKNIALKNEQSARLAAKTKSDFLASMSHEIRTPMNGVLGMIELLSETGLSSQQKEYLSVARHSGESLLHIINDILDYSKMEAGKLNIENQPLDLNLLLGNCLQVFAAESHSKSIQLQGMIHAEVGCHMLGDYNRLMQIVINLVGNAFKFTDAGRISIDISHKRSLENTDVLLFEIQDTGIGISEDNCKKLFQSFSQVHDTVDRSYGGTGLGLAISRQLIHLMGGEIGVDSELGKGTKFWFTVSLQQDKYSPGPKDEERINQLIYHKRILLIEADSVLSSYLLRLGRNWRLQMQSANTLAAALVKLGEVGYDVDLAIIDLDLPGSHNSDSVAPLIELLNAHGIPFLTLSAMNRDNSAVVGDDISGHFVKPIIPHYLKEKVAQRFGYSAGGRSNVESTAARSSFALTALIVDDNLVNCMVAKGMLANLGVASEVTTDSQRALDLLSWGHKDYDLVFMDCEMPVMDGFEVTQKVREAEGQKNLKANYIVALTAHVLPEYQRRATQSGMNDFISKPLQKIELAQLLSRFSAGLESAEVPSQTVVALTPRIVE